MGTNFYLNYIWAKNSQAQTLLNAELDPFKLFNLDLCFQILYGELKSQILYEEVCSL